MDDTRMKLQSLLERYYREAGWKIECRDDGTVRASGVGGVTWIGLPVMQEDLQDEGFPGRLLELSEQRMPRGELCPLELLPEVDAADALRTLLATLRLADCGHVEVYSLAA